MKLFTFFKVIWLHISCIFLSSPLQITEFNECTLCRRIIFKEPFNKIFIVSFFRLWKPSGKNTSSKLIKTVLFSFIGDTCDNNWFRCKTFSFYVEEKKCLVLLFVCIWPYSRTIHHQGLGVTWFWRQSPRNIFKSSWLMYSLGNSSISILLCAQSCIFEWRKCTRTSSQWKHELYIALLASCPDLTSWYDLQNLNTVFTKLTQAMEYIKKFVYIYIYI